MINVCKYRVNFYLLNILHLLLTLRFILWMKLVNIIFLDVQNTAKIVAIYDTKGRHQNKKAENCLQLQSSCHGLSWTVMDDFHG